VCDPERSCTLNRDEGLSSAFILAHELGHILGLSHDGDLGAGNSCAKEAMEGSVMASMVAATFSYFHWSSCSAGEYHYKAGQWACMQQPPQPTTNNYTFIGERIEYEYSAGWSLIRAMPIVGAFSFPIHVPTCGARTGTRQSCAKQRKDRQWMGRPVERIGGA
jgi:hypothetical protein